MRRIRRANGLFGIVATLQQVIPNRLDAYPLRAAAQ
jgi:hypothetical protein